MCVEGRVRYKCQHLGRYTGFENNCQWYDINEEMTANGVSEGDPLVMANEQLCRMHSSYKYHDHDDLCVNCLESGEEGKGRGKGKGREKEREKEREREKLEEEDEEDEKRDTIYPFLPTLEYDSRNKVKFSIGPSSSDSSRNPSVAGDRVEYTLPENHLLYPVPEARFDYPIGDMTMDDMDRFDKHFKIKAPDSDNWIFYSGKGTRYEDFARFKNTADPTFNAKHFGDMYPGEAVRTHLMRYLRKENQYKASAMSFYRFSCAAKGHIHLLLPRDCKDPLHPYPDNSYGVDGPVDSYWELFEMWPLTSMGRVRKITRYNADDFSEVGTIWQIGQSALGEPPDFDFPPRPFVRESSIDDGLYLSSLFSLS
jgi:hypothetical protein